VFFRPSVVSCAGFGREGVMKAWVFKKVNWFLCWVRHLN